jgi:hypothetical protein
MKIAVEVKTAPSHSQPFVALFTFVTILTSDQ